MNKPTNNEIKTVITDLLTVIDDFMPNVGRCALQNYQKLNEAPINARRLIARLDEGKTP